MAASLKGIDPVLKMYLKRHKLPDIYEALLSGLAIMCPEDPYQFIIENLVYLKESHRGSIEWDMFIEEYMKPKSKLALDSNLEYIFNFDESTQPTPEMYEKAYSHYNKKLKTMCYSHWMRYHLHKRQKRETLEAKMNLAAYHHVTRILRTRFTEWSAWMHYRLGRQRMAFNKIQHVYHVTVGRVYFRAWHSVTLDAKKTREYFERLERGENMDDEDGFKSTGEARDDISNLPKKVSVKIFSYVDICDLARCACVCRSWKVITTTASLWSRLDLTKVRYRPGVGFDKHWVTDAVAIKLLFKCRPYLVHLNLRGCTDVTPLTFQSIRECKNLQDLNLSESPLIKDETIKMVTEGCKILLYLNISRTPITDAALRTIAKNCHNLQYLSVARCKQFTDRGLHYLGHGKGAIKLCYCDISGCTQLTAEGFKSFAQGCINLQTVVLEDLSNMTDNCFEYIVDHCSSLKSLSILGSPNVTDESLKKLATCRKLQKLKIDANHKVSDQTFKTLGRQLSDLRHLYMTDCQRITDMSLKNLAGCKNLTVLNLADCVRVSDTGVRHIVESSCGPKLRELNLTNCVRVGDLALVNINKRCPAISYLCLNHLVHIKKSIDLLGKMTTLVSLSLSGVPHFRDKGLSSLGNNDRLKNVNLSECVSITDLGLQKFAQQCPAIECLDISHCPMLTDGAVKNLAFCCRMLMSLNLAGCKLLTDLSIQYLSGVCHYLVHLDISGSLHISDKSLKYLKKGCRKLQILVMLYCRNITKQGAAKIQKHIPEVNYSDENVPDHYNY